MITYTLYGHVNKSLWRQVIDTTYTKPKNFIERYSVLFNIILLVLCFLYYAICHGLTINLYVKEPTSLKNEIVYFHMYRFIGRILIFLLFIQIGVPYLIIHRIPALVFGHSNKYAVFKIFLSFSMLCFVQDITKPINCILSYLFRSHYKSPFCILECQNTSSVYVKQRMGVSRMLLGTFMESFIAISEGKCVIRAIIATLTALVYYYLVLLFLCGQCIDDTPVQSTSKTFFLSDRNGNNVLVNHNKHYNNKNLIITI